MRGWVLPGLVAAGLSIAVTAAITDASPPKKAAKGAFPAPPAGHPFEVGPEGFRGSGMSRGRLGVEVIEMSDELRAYFGAPRGTGVLVNRVVDGTPAKAAGLRVGDVIVDADGEPVAAGHEIVRAMDDRKKGDKVTVVVVRDKQRLTLTASLAEDPRPEVSAFGPGGMHGMLQGDPRAGWPQWQGPIDDRLESIEKRLDALEKRR
jgi:S1-C subfamily serine protease